MKRVFYSILFVHVFILISACTNGDKNINTETMENTDDLQTLIETNEYLVQELSSEKEEVEQLKSQIDELEEENMDLKDDILTFKQQIYELEDLRKEEQRLRNELDEVAKTVFEAMHERKHYLLEELVADNILVSAGTETLEIVDAEQRNYNFHYLKLDQVNYIRQTDFEYDPEEGTFTSDYTFHSVDGKDVLYEQEVYLTFNKESEWKLSSISYNK